MCTCALRGRGEWECPKYSFSWVGQCIPVIPVSRGLRQEDRKFEASVSNLVTYRIKKGGEEAQCEGPVFSLQSHPHPRPQTVLPPHQFVEGEGRQGQRTGLDTVS